MIKHIVLFRFKPEASVADKERGFHALAAMRNEVPEILEFSWGPYCGSEGMHKEFDYAISMDFRRSEDVIHYLNHPTHKKIVDEYFMPHLFDSLNSVLAFDYEYHD